VVGFHPEFQLDPASGLVIHIIRREQLEAMLCEATTGVIRVSPEVCRYLSSDGLVIHTAYERTSPSASVLLRRGPVRLWDVSLKTLPTKRY